jgi:tripartite-type tricarboxylate transporter receptor subunit TctC
LAFEDNILDIRQRRLFFGFYLWLANAGFVCAQGLEFPTTPITIVVPFAAGSGTDQTARAMGQSMAEEFGTTVVIENRGGANGMLAAQYVAQAKPNGYTLLLTTNTTQVANQHLYKKLPYDPVKDFQPIGLIGRGSMFLVVNASSKIKTVEDLIQAARTTPGKLNFGSGSSSSLVGSELLKQMAKIDVTSVPYKSNPQAVNDLMGSQIDYMFLDSSTALPLIRAGRLHPLAVSAATRSQAAPAVPTVAETGLQGFEVTYWNAVYAPAGVAPDIVEKLAKLIAGAALSKRMVSRQESLGSEAITSTPSELAEYQASEVRTWGRIIRAAGIEPE